MGLEVLELLGFRVDALRFALLRVDGGWVARLRAERVRHPGFGVELTGLEVDCRLASARQLWQADCPAGTWSATVALDAAAPVAVSGNIARVAGDLRLDGRFAGGSLAFEQAATGASSARFAAPAALVLPALGARFEALANLQWRAGDLRGRWSRAASGGQQLSVEVDGLAGENPAGTRAVEDLVARLDVRERRSGATGVWNAELALTGGVVLVDAWFVDFDELGPARLQIVDATLAPAVPRDGAAGLSGDARITLGDVFEATVAARGLRTDAAVALPGLPPGWRVDSARAALLSEQLGVVWSSFVEPLGAGTLLADLSLEGRLDAGLRWDANGLVTGDAALSVPTLADRRGRLAFDELDVDATWSRSASLDDERRVTRVEWAGGSLLGLPLGPHVGRWALAGNEFVNVGPQEWPLLDGALRADRLRLLWPAATEDGRSWIPTVEFEGGLRPVSLAGLSDALGWPPFTGRVAGIIPRVRGSLDALEVDGRLQVDVFDGQVFLSDIVLRDPLGRAPELRLSADVQRIELGQLTTVLDVGRIEGRLSGHVHDLQLIAWQPVAMDLWLATPDHDPGRRRISQRAVRDLTAVGGAQAALSRTFLSFFESFGYARLGVGCRLRREVCVMRGVADRDDGGFVLVEGGGLPRLELIGYQRRVDWPVLVERLLSIPDRDVQVR